MAALYEVGKKVKVEVDGLPYAATIITYKDDDPVTYIVSIDGLETRIITETDISGELDGNENLNYVQTITGTLAEPWGDVDFDELGEALQSGNATAIIEADATALGFGTITSYITGYYGGSPERNLIRMSDGTPASDGGTTAFSVHWDADGNHGFNIFASGTYTNALAYASLVPTTLTIIWHPLS